VVIPLLAQFHAEYPTIRVQLENIPQSDDYDQLLRVQLAGDQPPDLFYLATQIAYELDQRGQLLPLDNLLRAAGLTFTTDVQPHLALYRDETAQPYCLPADVTKLAVVYNRTLFDAAAVEYPPSAWTWDDLLATAKRLTVDTDGDGTIDQYGIDRAYSYWPLLVWSATGHNLFDDPQAPTAFLLEEEASVKAVQWLADLQLTHGVMPPPTDSSDTENLFLAGKAAMQLTDQRQLPSYLAADLTIDLRPLPVGDYTVNRGDGNCWAIARKSTHPEEAWTFLKFLAGPSGIGPRMVEQAPLDNLALSSFYEDSFILNPLATADNSQLNLAPDTAISPTIPALAATTDVTPTQLFPLYDPIHPLYADWQPIVDRELAAVWLGQRTADEAIGALANAAEDLLEDLPTSLETPLTRGPATQETPLLLYAQPTQQLQRLSDLTSATVPLSGTVPLSDTASSSDATAALQLPKHYFVAPTGNDAYSGLRVNAPLATIQHALTLAKAGDTIHLASGDYFENLTSVNSGHADAPITITGPADAILRGSGKASAAFYLTDDYYTLTGFTIDGLYGDPADKNGYTQKLLYVQGKEQKKGVTGLRVLAMRFQNAGGECIRLRYFAEQNEIAYSSFQTCGLLDFVFGEGGKNGEAIYVGTAPDQLDDGKNPTVDPDESSNNWIHHNQMDTQGNECVEIKEGGYNNLIEYNLCTGQLDPASAGIGSRGNNNIIRYNTIYDNVGAGIRLGGHKLNDRQYGIENEVYGNYLFGNIAGGVKIINAPQKRICSNQLERNWGKQAFGDGSEGYEPTAACQ